MKREKATAWVCACVHPDVEYDQCNPRKPFKSLSRTKVAAHERNHLTCIDNHKKLMAMVADAPNVIGSRLRVGTWDDWKGILEATKAFAKLAHEHQGIYRRSFFIYGASDNLIKAVRTLIWCQTKEGHSVDGERWMKEAFRTLEAMFNDIKLRGERKRCPKKSFMTRMFTAKKLLGEIRKEVGLCICSQQTVSALHESHGEIQ
ncbi:MAG: hypothetical protein UX58_C0011G0021 [Candidatus Wolfebacteria bacterium GW2011_GWB2_46_69]|nr:MAG: hypothetical protein UX58_C0011G0021 [Candidatus Wolfebacteria bacterium GW2011_GWB2_46_69]